MVGGILGAKGGPDSIPNDMIDGLLLCPFSMKSFQGLSAQLQSTLETANGDDVEKIRLSIKALSDATDDFAAKRMDRSIRAALTGKSLDSL